MSHTNPRVDRGAIENIIRQITHTNSPRQGQVEAVNSLLRGQDTILIAATGYGKSAVLYAYAALSKKITIQIVPLTKLGENQRDNIAANVPESTPIWIDQDTHKRVGLSLPARSAGVSSGR